MDRERPAPEGDDDRESAYELLQRGSALMKQRHFAQAATVLERADRVLGRAEVPTGA